MIQKYFTTGGGGNEEDVSQGFTFSDQLIIQKYFTGGGRNEEDVSQGFTFIGQLDQHCLGFSGWLDSLPPRPSRLPVHIHPALSAMYKVRSFVCYRTQIRS